MSDTWDQFKPAPALPVQTPAPSWGQFKPASQAMSKAAVSANDSPDDAGRALTISKQTGIPASIVQTDLPGYDAHAKTEAAKSATANPAIAKYIDSHPSAATVSNDDWDNLDRSSAIFQGLASDAIHNESHRQVVNSIPELADMLSTAAGRSKLNDAVNNLPATLWGDIKESATAASMGVVSSVMAPITLAREDNSFWGGFIKQFDPRPKFNAVLGAAGLGLSIPLGAVTTFGARPLAIATGLPLDQVQEAVGTSLFGLRPSAGVKIAKPGLPATIDNAPPSFADALRTAHDRADINEFLKQRATGNYDPSKFKSPDLQAEVARYKPGEPAPDPVVQAKAEVAGAAIDEAVQVAQESKTKARSPELYEEYIKAHGNDGTVHVPAQAILDLYDREKKVPIAGDGLFGFVPGILDKATLAAETGAEVKIPISKYVANIDPAVHEGLKDSVRVHEDGVTREEAKAAVEEHGKASPDTVRFYHGGEDPTAGGPRWLTPDPVYARDFRSMGEPNTVHFVDILKTAFEENGIAASGFDEINNYHRNFEAPEEIAKQLKPFGEVKDKIQEPTDPVEKAAVQSIKKEKQSLYLEPLFKDGSALNVTQTEFKQYSNLIDRAQENILTKAVAFAKREASKRLTPEWKANEARERQAVEQELYDSPVWQADRFFNTDKGLLPGGGPRTPKEVVPTLDMIKSDDWAPIFGFESGIDMTTALLAHEAERADAGKGPKWQFKQQVDAETARRMEAKHGRLEDNIAIEASEAALADYNVDLLAAEWKLLAKHNGVEPPLSRAELTTWARDQFDRSIASEVSYEQWRRGAEKGGREAEKALLKGDFKEAFAQKQKQMLSFLLAKEAKGFEKEVGKAERLFDKYSSEVNLPAVDQRYTDQVHRLLQQYGIETKRTTENTDYNLQGKDLATFVQERNANGDLIVQANLPTPRPGSNRPIDQFTVDQYRDFATMIKSLDHNGREAKKIEIAGKKEEFYTVIDQIAKNLDTLEKSNFDPAARGPISGLRKLGRAVDSRLLKAEKLIDWIDKKDPLGAFNSSVLRGLIEGEQGKGDMITKLAGMAKELPGDRAWGKGLNDATTNKELMDWETGKPMQLSNENKIAIALNYGNKSNRRVMLEGYKWTEAEVETYLARELTPMDKAMVDGIHGLFEPLAPLVEKTTANRAGVAIPLVEGTPTLGMKGGYYPLIEDPRAKLLGQQVTTDLFQKTNFDLLPTANALKQRTGKVYPIDLSISQIHSRLSQTAHAVFMQEPVVNANKVISDPFVREGIAKAFGPEYVEMLDKWVRDIANNGGADDDRMAAWLSRNLRQNVVVQLMGWKASTALIHGGSAGASSVYELGKMDMDTTGNPGRSFMLAPARLVQNIYNLGLGQFLPNAARRMFGSQSGVFDAVDFVLDNSGEMRNRTRSLQKDFGFQLDKITNSSLIDDAAKLRAVHQTYSMAMVSYLDQLTATPVWKAAYDKATVADGMEHADAVYVADKAVREAHGSASLVSRANIGRGEVNKWLTIAYNGYWNHNYNKMREAGKEVGGYDDSLSNWQRIAIGAAFISAMIIAPALVHHAVRGEESKTTGGAIANMMVSQFGGTVPVVNALTYSIMHNRDPSVSPIEEVLKSVTTLGKDAMRAGSDKPVLHPFKDSAKAVGFLTGLPPTNQVIDTFSFINDVVNRKEDPKTTQEWARGLMMGHAKAKAH